MNKLTIFIFLAFSVLSCCQETKSIPMDLPDNLPPLLQIEKGIKEESQKAKIVFQKYVQTRSLNAEGNRLYSNGDYYEIYKPSTQNLKNGKIAWRKLGTISKKGIDELEEISENSLMHYINNGPHKVENSALEDIFWYFYFDEFKYVETQTKSFQWQWWSKPKFISQVNKTMERYISFDQ